MITVLARNSVKLKHNITEAQIYELRTTLNDMFQTDDELPECETQLYLDVEDDGQFEVKAFKKLTSDFFKPDQHLCRVVLSPKSFLDAASKAVQEIETIVRCSHSNHTAGVSLEGVELTNGVATCCDCQSVSRPNYLESIKGNQTIVMRELSFSAPRYYVTAYDWCDVGIQGGDRGVVFGKHVNRRTAFFEAFPTISGIKTFIRGEGVTIKEAEEVARAKYDRQMECDGHEWCRTYGRHERTDGYGSCTKCNLGGKVLEPTTKCHICNTPTTKQFYEEYICTDHHNLLTFEQLFEESKAFNQTCLDDEESFLPDYQTQHEVDVANFEEMISLTFKVAYRDERLKRGLPFPVEENDMIDYNFLHSFKENVFKIPSYEKVKTLPKPDNKAMAYNLEHIKKNMHLFVDGVEAGNADFKPLIVGMLQVGVNNKVEAINEKQD